MFREGWKGRGETLGANHEDTLESLSRLRDIIRDGSPFTKTAPKPKPKPRLRESLSPFLR